MQPLNRLMVCPSALAQEAGKPFAMRYIAGERLADAIRVLGDLNARNMVGTVDVLGENVSTKEESLRAMKACEDVWQQSKNITSTPAFPSNSPN
jgi:hypothetical protein